MTWTESDWERLGAALAAARECCGHTQERAATLLGIGKSTLQAIEAGAPRKKATPTIKAFARLVGWTEASPERILSGGEPERLPATSSVADLPTPDAPAEPDAPDLSLRVRQAIAEGPLLDSQVITVPTEGGEIVATIVVRGEVDRTPEELHAALLAWRERERALHGLDSDEASENRR